MILPWTRDNRFDFFSVFFRLTVQSCPTMRLEHQNYLSTTSELQKLQDLILQRDNEISILDAAQTCYIMLCSSLTFQITYFAILLCYDFDLCFFLDFLL